MRRENAIGACRPRRRFPLMEEASCNRRTQNRSNISESCNDIGTCVLPDLQQENEVRRRGSARRICRRRAVVFMRMRTYSVAKLRTRGIAELVIRIQRANGEPAAALVLKAADGSQAKNHKMTKAFDWKRFSEVHKPEWTAWLETNHAKPVTEAEYMTAYRVQRIVDTRPNKSRRYSTSKLRGNYRKLRNDYGFFV
jgi:hypothetical protein